jgi:hypothetical protein
MAAMFGGAIGALALCSAILVLIVMNSSSLKLVSSLVLDQLDVHLVDGKAETKDVLMATCPTGEIIVGGGCFSNPNYGSKFKNTGTLTDRTFGCWYDATIDAGARVVAACLRTKP